MAADCFPHLVSPVLGIPNSPFSSIIGKPPGYPPAESESMTADFLAKFDSMARMASHRLDSRSSSPEDSETSGFSSGSDHLCDMLVRKILGPLAALLTVWLPVNGPNACKLASPKYLWV